MIVLILIHIPLCTCHKVEREGETRTEELWAQLLLLPMWLSNADEAHKWSLIAFLAEQELLWITDGISLLGVVAFLSQVCVAARGSHSLGAERRRQRQGLVTFWNRLLFWFFFFPKCLTAGILHLSETLLFMAKVVNMQLMGCSSILQRVGFLAFIVNKNLEAAFFSPPLPFWLT